MSEADLHSIWLVPNAGSADRLEGIINHLGSRYGTPIFAPHVTLLGDLLSDCSKTLMACQTAFASIDPIVATVNQFSRTEHHFMSVFLDVELSPNLSVARSSIFETISVGQEPSFRPHVSLAYGLPLSVAIDAETRCFIDKFIGQHFVFDKVSIVRSAKTIPVCDWSQLDEVSLNNGR